LRGILVEPVAERRILPENELQGLGDDMVDARSPRAGGSSIRT
jgi:hypothetical protein